MSKKVPRALLIYNPVAPRLRRGREGKLGFVADAFRIRGVVLDTLMTEGPGHVLASADLVEGRGYDLLIAWGGDGTVNEVGNLASRLSLPLAILPGGTVNILARELGIPGRLADAVLLLFDGRLRSIKAGRAGGRLFFAMAGAGYDAAVCRRVRPALKRALGRLAYVVEGARLLFTYPFPLVSVVCDGRGFSGTQIIVSNVSRYAGNLRLTPHADLSREAPLDLCVLRGDSALGYARFFYRLLRGRHTRWRDLLQVKGWKFSVLSSEPVPVHLDGEHCGTLPMRFEAVPDALQVVAPAGPAPSPLFQQPAG
jgi:YegS/Rv2252/BmrU family lipid kinase